MRVESHPENPLLCPPHSWVLQLSEVPWGHKHTDQHLLSALSVQVLPAPVEGVALFTRQPYLCLLSLFLPGAPKSLHPEDTLTHPGVEAASQHRLVPF